MTTIQKALTTDKDYISDYKFVITSEAIDRGGDRILADGVDYSAYLTNPVVFLNHDTYSLPIGKATSITKEIVNGVKSLVAKVEFDTQDPTANLVKSKIDGGFLNTTSVGIRVLNQEQTKLSPIEQSQYDRQSINTITKSELYEFSIVTIPMNQTATRIKLFTNEEEEILTKAGRVLSQSNFDKLTTAQTLIDEVVSSSQNTATASASADSQTKGETMTTNSVVNGSTMTSTGTITISDNIAAATYSAVQNVVNPIAKTDEAPIETVSKSVFDSTIATLKSEMETKLFEQSREKSNMIITTQAQTPQEEIETKLFAFAGVMKDCGNIAKTRERFNTSQNITKQLDTLTQQSGGILVAPAAMGELLPWYYADSILPKLKTRNMPMAKPEMRWPRSGSISPGTFTPKYGKSTEKDITFSDITLKAFQFKDHFVIGNDLLTASEIDIVNFLKSEITMYMPTWYDSKFLYGTGGADTPEGIYTQMLAANKVAQTGTTLAAIKTDTLNAIKRIKTTKIRLDASNGAWIMHPDNLMYLRTLTDSNGNTPDYLRYLDQAVPTLWGIPIVESHTINATEIILGNFNHVFFGTHKPLDIKFVFEGNWQDAAGDTFIGSSIDKSPLFISGAFGQTVAYTSALSAITTVTWGS